VLRRPLLRGDLPAADAAPAADGAACLSEDDRARFSLAVGGDAAALRRRLRRTVVRCGLSLRFSLAADGDAAALRRRPRRMVVRCGLPILGASPALSPGACSRSNAVVASGSRV
jgi:hypothetical protein